MNLAGLREDGRRPGEIRKLSVKLGHDGAHDGSACFQIGQTRILAEVFGPHELISRRQECFEKAIVKVDFSPVPFSESDSKRKRIGPNKQSSELVLAVQKALEASIMVTSYPNTQIDVCLTVLQDDGGKLPACINAASLAVIDAGIAMTDLLVACSVGILKGVPVVDLNYREQSPATTLLPVAIHPSTEKVVLCTMNSRLQLKELEPLLELAVAGCHQVHSVLAEAVRDHTEYLLERRRTMTVQVVSRQDDDDGDDE